MDIFGVGGGELLLLLFFGGIILGPRRIIYLVRETRRLSSQIRGLATNLTHELDREIARSDAAELKTQPTETEPPAKGEEAAEELPEAYRRFAEDFPEEALAEPAAPPTTQPPVTPPTPTVAPSPSTAVAPTLAPVRSQPPVRPPIRVGPTRVQNPVNPIRSENGNTPANPS